MKTKNELILTGIAKAFFACAWADMQEQSENGVNLSGAEIFDVMPETIDPAAIRAADKLATALKQCNGVSDLAELYKRAQKATKTLRADRALEPKLFGHYCAMEAMGHGVGLESFGLDTVDGGIVREGETLRVRGDGFYLAVPYMGSIELDADY